MSEPFWKPSDFHSTNMDDGEYYADVANSSEKFQALLAEKERISIVNDTANVYIKDLEKDNEHMRRALDEAKSAMDETLKGECTHGVSSDFCLHCNKWLQEIKPNYQPLKNWLKEHNDAINEAQDEK